MTRIEAHARNVQRLLGQAGASAGWPERKAAAASFAPIFIAAKCWERFAEANPQEAALIEAGVSVADALRKP